MVNASKIREPMEVFGSCGNHIGTVDRVEGNFLKLTRSDPGSREPTPFLPARLGRIGWPGRAPLQVLRSGEA